MTLLSTYVLLKVLEYKIEGSDRSALLTQIVRIAPMMTKRDGLGFNGNMIARYLKTWNGETRVSSCILITMVEMKLISFKLACKSADGCCNL